jgi:hypothetical protein
MNVLKFTIKNRITNIIFFKKLTKNTLNIKELTEYGKINNIKFLKSNMKKINLKLEYCLFYKNYFFSKKNVKNFNLPKQIVLVKTSEKIYKNYENHIFFNFNNKIPFNKLTEILNLNILHDKFKFNSNSISKIMEN